MLNKFKVKTQLTISEGNFGMSYFDRDGIFHVSKNEGPPTPVTLLLTPELLDVIENLRREARGKIPSRHRLIQELLGEAIAQRLKSAA